MNILIKETSRMKEVEIFLIKLKSLSKEKREELFLEIDTKKIQSFLEYCIIYTTRKNDIELLSLFLEHTSEEVDTYYAYALEEAIEKNCIESRDLLLKKEHFLKSLKIYNFELYEDVKKIIFKNKLCWF